MKLRIALLSILSSGCAVSLSGRCPDLPVHGKVVATRDDYIKDAQIDRVLLYSRKDGLCDQVFEREALLVHYKNAIATIVLCHGFMCEKADMNFLRNLFPYGKFNFLTFDFRAHGEKTDGQNCTLGKNEAYDVIAAAQFLKNDKRFEDKPLFVYGFSMGAVAAIEAQALEPTLFQAMILDCPFDSSEQVIMRGLDSVDFSFMGYKFKMPGRSLLTRYAFHPYVQSVVKQVLKTVAMMDPQHVSVDLHKVSAQESVKKIAIPAFFIVCKNDKRSPVKAVRSLYESASSSYKKLWVTNGRRHFDSYFNQPEKYTEHVQSFLEESLNGNAHSVRQHEVINDPVEL